MTAREDLLNHLGQGVATVCRAWLVARKDGVSFGFTDHDSLRDVLPSGALDQEGSVRETLDSDSLFSVLEDDRHYFPRYDAVLLYRADLPQRLPKTWSALQGLEGAIDDASMRRMNAAAELDNKDFASVAAGFVATSRGYLHRRREA